MTVDGGDDVLLGGPGDDSIHGDHRVFGDVSGDGGDDRIEGGQGSDNLLGDSDGFLSVSGAGGNDTLDGGPDDDVQIAGDNNTGFLVSGDGGNDTIAQAARVTMDSCSAITGRSSARASSPGMAATTYSAAGLVVTRPSSGITIPSAVSRAAQAATTRSSATLGTISYTATTSPTPGIPCSTAATATTPVTETPESIQLHSANSSPECSSFAASYLEGWSGAERRASGSSGCTNSSSRADYAHVATLSGQAGRSRRRPTFRARSALVYGASSVREAASAGVPRATTKPPPAATSVLWTSSGR